MNELINTYKLNMKTSFEKITQSKQFFMELLKHASKYENFNDFKPFIYPSFLCNISLYFIKGA